MVNVTSWGALNKKAIGASQCAERNRLWAVTYIDCQPCMPEYFDDWQQATLFLMKLDSYR
ncbi:MAG: hypothetical protein QNJ53_23790 [Pleurocapsa sp. MO_192.B19]|nr:hypothetical protein [Pleurocapsa sp. MO_192.B19]